MPGIGVSDMGLAFGEKLQRQVEGVQPNNPVQKRLGTKSLQVGKIIFGGAKIHKIWYWAQS